MNKHDAICIAKTFRQDLDTILQRMKDHLSDLKEQDFDNGQQGDRKPEAFWGDNEPEAIAQHTISIRDLESAIMRQGMVLKYVGNPNPYPQSYDPSSSVVEPTADGLKL